MLTSKNILFGVTGSIAAYKSVDIIRRLKAEGANVTVVMTESACRFIPSFILEAVSENPVYTNLFDGHFRHINLVKDAHLLIIAPATANTINKLACGIADNLLSSLYLAYEGPVLIAPAMNQRMYRNPIVKKHITELTERGVSFIGPESGSLACGEEGLGRMSETPDIVDSAISALTPKDLSGHNILVTAGPTREAIDPIRFISNRSSGKMGFALATAAFRRGAKVTLISGHTSLKPSRGILFIPVETSAQMESALLKNLSKSSIVIMAAAVCDFAPHTKSKTKIQKGKNTLITLKETPDILRKIAVKKGNRFLVGFAAETGRNIKNAKEKLKNKKLDLIVLNDVTQKGAGFDVDTNVVTLINRKGEITDYPLMKKYEVANIILNAVLRMRYKKQTDIDRYMTDKERKQLEKKTEKFHLKNHSDKSKKPRIYEIPEKINGKELGIEIPKKLIPVKEETISKELKKFRKIMESQKDNPKNIL